MKRSPGSPINGGSAKHFEAMRSSPQMQLQQQFHQQMQNMHHHQQQQKQQLQEQQQNVAIAAALSVNQPFFSTMTSPSSGISMMPYSSSVQPPNAFHYNAAGMTPNVWGYQMPTTPPLSYDATQPPLPLVPPQPHPPLPPIETFQKNFTQNRSTAAALRKTKGLNAAAPVDSENKNTHVKKKSKRKSMSNRYGVAKEWDITDAIEAIALEREYSKKAKCEILLLRFPDPELNRNIVSEYSPQIESVHFQQNSAPRYCFVHLKEGADALKVMETISKIKFGNGFIKAELKHSQFIDPPPVNPEDIDPYTLYIGNLPTSISTRIVKEHFPGAHRIDIGFAQRMKFTRYAFVRYSTIEESLNAFRNSVNTIIDSRSLIVRFRRQHGNVSYGEQMPRKEPDLVEAATNALAIAEALNKSESNAAIKDLIIKNSIVASEEDEEGHHLPKITRDTPSISNNNPLDVLESGTAFDSPTSLEEPEQVEVESKLNVLRDAESFKQRISVNQSLQGSNRRSSVEEMFEELERRQRLLATSKPCTVARVKDELDDYDDLSEDEEEPQLNLLGSRYENEESQIKTEPDDDENIRKDEMYQEDFDFEDEFDMDPEEDDDEDWLDPTTMHSNKVATGSNNTAQNSNWEAIRKRELSDVETKADVAHFSNINSPSPVHFDTHAADVEKLHEQRRKFMKSESSRKPRDDLDDMFSQIINYDGEDEDDFF